jgi:hypothetical protein
MEFLKLVRVDFHARKSGWPENARPRTDRLIVKREPNKFQTDLLQLTRVAG